MIFKIKWILRTEKIFFILIWYYLFKNVNIKMLNNKDYLYKKYIYFCKKSRRFNIIENKSIISPYLSICLVVYNMEKYIERALLSILNQSFKDYEIIIINDFSNDKTNNIINNFQMKESKIKIYYHHKNLGTFASRVDAVLKSSGKYIIFLDPDDLFLNPNLFKRLYAFNLKYNLDIIEFTVYNENEDRNNLYYPEDHRINHYHNFSDEIIYQPELSNILFYDPKTGNISYVYCRNIWNKIIKKNILLKTFDFIGKEYYKSKYFIFAEDTIMNILNFQFSSNYSNIYLPGYMYNIRINSASHGDFINISLINDNAFLYLSLFFKYIKYFSKTINILLYEMIFIKNYLSNFKGFNHTYFDLKSKSFFKMILDDKNLSLNSKFLINNFSFYY